jgi:sucrose-6-phosphate hydrolase SacC (GH32 family)
VFIERELTLDHRYLNVPVKADAPRRTISVTVGGRVVRAFEVELAEGEPDFWAFTDVSAWQGQRATIRLDAVGRLGNPESQKLSLSRPISPRALETLRLAEEIADAASLYREPLRPQFHFTARRGWINDPNGLLWYQGEYHLFFQHQPFSMKSLNGDKAWGHAVSRDLVHWEELSEAIYPDEHGGAYSGSTLVDEKNVAGFQSGAEPALLLFYTAVGRSAMNPKPTEPADYVQRLAYSNDRGRTWSMFAGNPVLKNITPQNRDPMVFWHAPSKRWVMVLYVGYPISSPGNHYTAQIFNSENLKDWTYQSRIEGFFDCPVLFELPLDGNAADTRWIIHCANMKYKVGRFDGKTFTPETELIDSHKGKVGESEYAPQIFRNLPARTVQQGWLYNEKPGARQLVTFPCDISLGSTPSGPRLRWQPVQEIGRLHGAAKTWRDLPLVADEAPVVRTRGRHLDLQTVIHIGDAREVEINVRGIPIVLHTRAKELTVRGYALPLVMKEDRLQLRLLLDETSLEIFADNGLVYLPLTIPPSGGDDAVTIGARGGTTRAESLDIIEVKSIWPVNDAPERAR